MNVVRAQREPAERYLQFHFGEGVWGQKENKEGGLIARSSKLY